MPDWSSGWGKETVPVLFVGRNPQDIPGYTGGTAIFYRAVHGAPATQQHHPASMALSDKLYREESNKCKEAGGAQDDLFDKEDNDKDINEDKDNHRDDKASVAKLIAVPAEERT
jgi:hypothetical protein